MEESVKAPKEEMVHRKENGWIAAFKFVPLILTFTGLDRFVPMLKLPSKDRIRLKKN